MSQTRQASLLNSPICDLAATHLVPWSPSLVKKNFPPASIRPLQVSFSSSRTNALLSSMRAASRTQWLGLGDASMKLSALRASATCEAEGRSETGIWRAAATQPRSSSDIVMRLMTDIVEVMNEGGALGSRRGEVLFGLLFNPLFEQFFAYTVHKS